MPADPDAPRVRLVTSIGDIVVALYVDRAPISVANFLRYVDEGAYDGTIFHRVEGTMPGPAVVQGGGYEPDLTARPAHEPIVSEAANGLANARGTVAMARTTDPNSATAQFYFNYLDNTLLDETAQRAGFAVFGVIVDGIDVLDRISMVPVKAVPATSFSRLPMVQRESPSTETEAEMGAAKPKEKKTRSEMMSALNDIKKLSKQVQKPSAAAATATFTAYQTR